MKKKRVAAAILSAVMAVSAGFVKPAVFAEDSAVDKAEYQYFMNTAENSAYVWLGETIEGKGLEFFDGQAMGIKDSNDPLYNETVILDGLTARKQYRANSSYFKIDKSLYDKDDHEVLFSLVFYDFGPSEGWFYFEYYATDGSIKQVALRKPGTNPGWSVKTIGINDIDLTREYENGANVRIQNGAYNAFKKLEFINISKAKRDKNEVKLTSLGVELTDELVSLMLLDADDERFTNQNLGKACTEYDAKSFLNKITNNGVQASAGNKTLTQGELVSMYMQTIGLNKNPDESWVEAATRYKMIDAMDFFLFDEAQATYFNLISIAHATLIYGGNDGKGLLADLINDGFYDNVDIAKVNSTTFQTVYYAQPRKLPYKRITDNVTGRTFNYINFFGQQMVRGYLDEQGWLPDGSGFVCGTPDGHLYVYDIETQMLTYLDKGDKITEITGAFVAGNGWVYYTRKEDGIDSIRRVHPKTLVKEKLFDLPRGLGTDLFNVTNDGHYATFETSDKSYVLADRPPNTEPIIRVDLWEGTMEYRYYTYTSMGVRYIDEEYAEIFLLKMAGVIENEGYDACLQKSIPNLKIKGDKTTNPEVIDTYELIYAEAVEEGKPAPDVIIDFGKAAKACGLGEMGLNGKIINKKYGPFMRYCFIITDAPLECDEPLTEEICDKCGECIKACPGNAIDENGLDTWQCAVYYKGAHKSNPFITDEFLKDHPERDAILNGEKRFNAESAREIYSELDFLPKTRWGYAPCMCGRKCDVACYKHLKGDF